MIIILELSYSCAIDRVVAESGNVLGFEDLERVMPFFSVYISADAPMEQEGKGSVDDPEKSL